MQALVPGESVVYTFHRSSSGTASAGERRMFNRASDCSTQVWWASLVFLKRLTCQGSTRGTRLSVSVFQLLAVPLLDLWKVYTISDTGTGRDPDGALLPPAVATDSALSYPKLLGESPCGDFVLENSTGMKLWVWQRRSTPTMQALVPGESVVIVTQGAGALVEWCVKPDGPWASVQGEQLLPSAYEAPSIVRSASALVVEFVSSTDAPSIPVVVRQSVDQQGEDRPRLRLSLTTHLCIHNHTSTQLRLQFHGLREVIREEVEPGGAVYAPR